VKEKRRKGDGRRKGGGEKVTGVVSQE